MNRAMAIGQKDDASSVHVRSSYREDVASLRRVLAQASAERRPAAFLSGCAEIVRWITVGGLEKPDVMDELREIGLGAGLTEGIIQSALVEAITEAEKAELCQRRLDSRPAWRSKSRPVMARQDDMLWGPDWAPMAFD